MLNVNYELTNNIPSSYYNYFETNTFIFNIKMKDYDKIITQTVNVVGEPDNFSEMNFPLIFDQKLFLNDAKNTTKTELEAYLFPIVRSEFRKMMDTRYNSKMMTEHMLTLNENKIYCLKSNISDVDNYQQPKTITVTIETLNPKIFIGSITTTINVQGITKNLSDIQNLFYFEDKILEDITDNTLVEEIITPLITNQFISWMKQQYNISLITTDFKLILNLSPQYKNKTKIIDVTISANHTTQTKISGQFSASFVISSAPYDINNLTLKIIKTQLYEDNNVITKLQLTQLIIPTIKQQLINIIKTNHQITITEYQDFYFNINAPETDTYNHQKVIEVIIMTTNQQLTGNLLLTLSVKRDQINNSLLINN